MAGTLHRLWYGDPPPALTASAEPSRSLTAAALSLRAGRDPIAPRYEQWQDEAWALWQELGELYYGVRWLAEMLSRIRLVPAVVPDTPGDEPAPFEGTGTPLDLVEQFAGGMGGQAEILRRLTVQLAVPGEGWLVGEPDPDGSGDRWTVRSKDEIREGRRRPPGPGVNGQQFPRRAGSSLAMLGQRSGGLRDYTVEVIDEDAPPNTRNPWRLLPPDALVVRIWNAHDRYYRQADSPVRHALATARRLQSANRYIQAQFLSRLASAGLLVLPDNVDFPTDTPGEDSDIVREWIATAETAIKNPLSAAALVPILMQLPPDVIDKVKFLDFTTAFDQKILDKRESAVRELATVIDLPPEILLGMGDVNHWGSWQIEETALKVHIAPRIEAICHAFTVGWYRPMLKEAGDDPAKYLIWYDPSEIVVRPDKSEKVVVAYDRGEANGEALRRESGLDESDKPEDEELLEWIGKQLVLGKGGESLVPVGYKLLTGEELDVPSPAPQPGSAPGGQGESTPEQGEEEEPPAEESRTPPGTRNTPPPPPGEAPPVAAQIEMRAPGTGWAMRRGPDGWEVWNLTHWLRVPPEQSKIIDRHRTAIAIAMNGKDSHAPVGP